ncbi:response regulator [Vibrio splendidus]|uniref:response regulator n=1 Tax=Vibrio splendidus TaxID=29497 RepID=UPI000D351909|nr:response regulator [Vibrio splendidus]PTP50609.1 hypothetical protein CWO05_19870 [Vibrio splendidus]
MQLTTKSINIALRVCIALSIFLVSLSSFVIYYEVKLTALESQYEETRENYFSLLYSIRDSPRVLRGYYESDIDIESFIIISDAGVQTIERLSEIVESYFSSEGEEAAIDSANFLEIKEQLIQHNSLFFSLVDKIDQVKKIASIEERQKIERQFIYELVNQGQFFRLRQDLFVNIMLSFQYVTEHSSDKTQALNTTIERLLYLVTVLLAVLLLFGFFLAKSIRTNIFVPIYLASQQLESIKSATQVFPLIETKSPECYSLFSALHEYSNRSKILLDDSRIQLNQINQLKEDAEQLAKNKQAFLSTMSHEIRTPLNSIIGGIQFMYKDFNHLQPVVDSLNDMNEASGLLLSVVNDILDFSKLESSNLSPDYSSCSTKIFVSSVCAISKNIQHRKGIKIQVWISKRTPMSFTSDTRRLTQVCINLINNSIVHSSSDVIRFKMDFCQKKKMLILKIIDFGDGIAKDVLETMFDPYESRSHHSQSTGLGLAISRKMVECMKGELIAKSTPGRGSCFTINIPLSEEKERGIPFSTYLNSHKVWNLERLLLPKVYSRYHFGVIAASTIRDIPIDNDLIEPFIFIRELDTIRENINKIEKKSLVLDEARFLVVEDFSLNRKLLGKLAKRHSLNFVFAEDGQQALEKAGENQYDIILMDIQMPVMDGFEATKSIRKLNGYSKTPIIALSAHVEENINQQCKEAGMDELIHKPFDIDVLRERIDFWLKD